MIYQFAFHDGVKTYPPECEAKQLHDKLAACQQLTRQEKNRLAKILYGVCGAYASRYMLGGWAFDFRNMLPCILVREKNSSTWREYYASDKTALRLALKTKQPMVVLNASHTKWR